MQAYIPQESISSKLEYAFFKLASKQPFLSFELTPLIGAHPLTQEALDALHSCTLFDSYVCTDSPLARFKPSSVLSSISLQHALHKPLICTLSMRDKNSIALCGEILAANRFHLRAFLSLSGDPITLGNTTAKAVYEDKSTKLNAIITKLNGGLDINNRPLHTPLQPIYNCNVINAYAINPSTIINKMKKKILSALAYKEHEYKCNRYTCSSNAINKPLSTPLSITPSSLSTSSMPLSASSMSSMASLPPLASCSISHAPHTSSATHTTDTNYPLSSPSSDASPTLAPPPLCAFFSQPVYDVNAAHILLESLEKANSELGTHVALVLGIFPVTSYKSALFLRDKLPGVFIPEAWICALEKARDKNEERDIGLELSRTLFTHLKALHNQFHIMTNGNLAIAQALLH